MSAPHIQTLLSSLSKMLNNVKYTGNVKVESLYVLDIIENVSLNLCLELKNNQYNRLRALYRDILYSSPEICNTSFLDSKTTIKNSKFVTKKVNPNDIVNISVIYGKAQLLLSDNNLISNIENDTWVDTSTTTISELSNGFEFESQNTGKLVILLTNVTNSVQIYDILNNDVTSQFNIYETTKGLCIISKYVFINEPLTLKITINHE